MDHHKQGMDTPLNITNQAAMGVWWGQLNSPKWRFMLVLIYNVVNDLGRQLTEAGVYQLIGTTELTSAKDLQTYFFKDVVITDA